MLDLSGVDTYYGNIQALRGITLNIKQGKIVTLIGANGAGKTTTLMTICGVVPPHSGAIHFEGKPIHYRPASQVVRLGIS